MAETNRFHEVPKANRNSLNLFQPADALRNEGETLFGFYPRLGFPKREIYKGRGLLLETTTFGVPNNKRSAIQEFESNGYFSIISLGSFI